MALEGIDANEEHSSAGADLGTLLNKRNALVGAIVVGVVVLFVALLGKRKEVPVADEANPIPSLVVPRNYDDAVSLLKNRQTAQEGLHVLDSLVNRNDADATYLLSRLYFKSKRTGDLFPDSIRQMQGNAQLDIDFDKAHELLLKVVELNPRHYHALYELGCDYLGGSARTDAVERNLDKAKEYFTAAMENAVGDSYYQELIQEMLSRFM